MPVRGASGPGVGWRSFPVDDMRSGDSGHLTDRLLTSNVGIAAAHRHSTPDQSRPAMTETAHIIGSKQTTEPACGTSDRRR